MVSKKLRQMLEKMHYELAGNHGAVQICMWCKESLLDKDFCYKQKFYGIRSHLCCQMTPIVDVCDSAVYSVGDPGSLLHHPRNRLISLLN